MNQGSREPQKPIDDEREPSRLNRLVEYVENKPMTVAIVVLIVWGTIGLLPIICFRWNLEEASKFSDSFGAVSSLFSGIAVVLAGFAILLQTKELRMQRQELKLTKVELQRQAESQESTAESIEMQLEVLKETSFINGLSSLIDVEMQARLQSRNRDPKPLHSLMAYLSILIDTSKPPIALLDEIKQIVEFQKSLTGLLTKYKSIKLSHKSDSEENSIELNMIHNQWQSISRKIQSHWLINESKVNLDLLFNLDYMKQNLNQIEKEDLTKQVDRFLEIINQYWFKI